MQKIDCNNDGSISVYEWIEQGKAIGMLDPLVSSSGTGKPKGKGKVFFFFFFELLLLLYFLCFYII